MHYRLYVTFDKEHAKTPREALTYVHNELSSDNSFVGDGGRFSSPICDWFVVGGRWSGDLAIKLVGEKKYWDTIEKAVPKKNNFGWSTQDIKDNSDKLQKAWKKLGGKDICPMARDSYRHEGYHDDDAMILTKELYKAILKQYEGKYEGKVHKEYEDTHWDELYYVDLDDNMKVGKDMVGKKWIVVVDYHS